MSTELAEIKSELKMFSYIGERLRKIRVSYLNKTQLEIVQDICKFYNKPNLFNQPKIYQIEMLNSMGTTLYMYINYVMSLGFNANWILSPDNSQFEVLCDTKSKGDKKGSQTVKEAQAIQKNWKKLKSDFETFNETLKEKK